MSKGSTLRRTPIDAREVSIGANAAQVTASQLRPVAAGNQLANTATHLAHRQPTSTLLVTLGDQTFQLSRPGIPSGLEDGSFLKMIIHSIDKIAIESRRIAQQRMDEVRRRDVGANANWRRVSKPRAAGSADSHEYALGA